MKSLKKILSYVKKCGASVEYDAPPYFIQQDPEEVSAFIFGLLKKGSFTNFMEIGSAAGGTTKLLDDFFHFKNIVILDNNSFNRKMTKIRHEQLKGLPVTELNLNSQSIEAKNAVKNLNIQFDLLFIDGDHSYNGVKNDYNNFLEFVKKGGYLAFHDTVSFPEVGKFVNELKNNKGVEFIKEYKSKKGRVLGLSLFEKK